MAVKELAENLKTPENPKFTIDLLFYTEKPQNNLKTMKTRLIELIKYYKEFNDFLTFNQNFMKITQFFAISINAVGIAMSIVILQKFSVFVGFTSLFVLICHIAYPCVLGALMEHQSHRIIDILWDFPFYELDIKDQKIFLQFLLFAQQFPEFEMPIFGNVDMELFKNVVYGGYSYFTFIINFI